MKLFADEHINPGRQTELDRARGLAVLFSIVILSDAAAVLFSKAAAFAGRQR